MTKLFLINTEARRAAVYAVEAANEQEALKLLSAAAANPATKPLLRAVTSEDVVGIGAGSVEDVKNALDIANMIPNSDALVQDNVHEDDIEKHIIRAEGVGLAVGSIQEPYDRLISDLMAFKPNGPAH